MHLKYLCVSSEQVSSGGMKSETVALSGPANPLLAGLQHYVDVSPPVLGIVKRYQRTQTTREREREADVWPGHSDASCVSVHTLILFELRILVVKIALL